MHAVRAIPIALFGVGASLVTVAVLAGRASATFVLALPVPFGSSLLFLAGVLAIVLGFLTLPPTWIGRLDPTPVLQPSEEAPPDLGGIVVIGPLPVFFGAARDAPSRGRLVASLAGALAVLGLVLWVLGI